MKKIIITLLLLSGICTPTIGMKTTYDNKFIRLVRQKWGNPHLTTSGISKKFGCGKKTQKKLKQRIKKLVKEIKNNPEITDKELIYGKEKKEEKKGTPLKDILIGKKNYWDKKEKKEAFFSNVIKEKIKLPQEEAPDDKTTKQILVAMAREKYEKKHLDKKTKKIKKPKLSHAQNKELIKYNKAYKAKQKEIDAAFKPEKKWVKKLKKLWKKYKKEKQWLKAAKKEWGKENNPLQSKERTWETEKESLKKMRQTWSEREKQKIRDQKYKSSSSEDSDSETDRDKKRSKKKKGSQGNPSFEKSSWNIALPVILVAVLAGSLYKLNHR